MPENQELSFDQYMEDITVQTRKVPNVSAYDFSRKEKLSPDQQKFLEKIFAQFSDYATTLIANLLQCKVQINLVSIKQSPYQHYLSSLPDPVSIMVFKINPETRGSLSLDYSLSFGILEKLMGGKGRPLDEIRSFTDLEKAVIGKAMVKFLEAYTESWKEVLDLKPQIAGMEFSPLSVHIVSPSELMIVAAYQAQVAQSAGFIELCLPFKYLKEIVPRASFEDFLLTRSSQSVPAQSSVPFFSKSLEAARVPVAVELGSAEVAFQDMLNLQLGDFIRLDKDYTQVLKIKVNERTKFLGRPGMRDGKLAIQVTKVLNEEDEEFEE